LRALGEVTRAVNFDIDLDMVLSHRRQSGAAFRRGRWDDLCHGQRGARVRVAGDQGMSEEFIKRWKVRGSAS